MATPHPADGLLVRVLPHNQMTEDLHPTQHLMMLQLRMQANVPASHFAKDDDTTTSKRLSELVDRSLRSIRPTRIRRNTDPFKSRVRWVRSLSTCLIYSGAVVFTLITLSTPVRVQ